MGKVIPIVYLTTFLFLFGESLQPAPRAELYERILCRNHYRSTTDVIHDCKISAVQQQLALLGGLERLSNFIPSLFAIPFAALADRYGHSFILSLAFFGIFLEELWPMIVCYFPDIFPIRLIWLHFIFNIFGGGQTMIWTLLHVIVADHVDATTRSTIFFRIRAAGTGSAVIGYAASGALMKISIWLPLIIALTSFLLGMVAMMFVPSQRVGKSDDADNESWQDRIRSAIQYPKFVFSVLSGNAKVMIIMALVTIAQLGFDSLPLMLSIYVSKKFEWSFANASFLHSLQMLVELTTCLTILPLIAMGLSRYGVSPFSKDLYIAQGSVAALVIGLWCLGLAPVIGLAVFGIVMAGLGTAQESVLRSMVTDMVDPEGVSIAYSAMTMLRTIGASVSGPIYAGLYAAGLDHGWSWLGLPYLFAGGLFALIFVVLLFFKDSSAYQPIPNEEVVDEDDA
ncbi:MFS general substrate transporter [Aaosphaeria arxii CBS 175.79]|uniref:MFS general substrate transporter n=1 Tax=Aaosphaeria arxii CBS 175.79 TaxID=1450172 RepID=A0A6A5XJ06_9PLEO|nr:MFS general substrate transporter [Aaosphaeria arxii CBS 175.79]KAF2012817.1 MFS general substrate transporter [Aaosphaeria arxii CBS 175.79]